MTFFPRILLTAVLGLPMAGGLRAEPAPPLSFRMEQGVISLESLKGKVVWLDYWASWCAPCRQSFPWMNEIQRRYAVQGLVVLAVNVDSDAAERRRFLAEHPAAFTLAHDPEGASARVLALKGMPSSFLIDRSGEIVARHVGFREASRATIEAEIRALLAR